MHEILRLFDLSYEYGPCVGVSRLARWERAHKAGLNPPVQVRYAKHTRVATKLIRGPLVSLQVKEILETLEGRKHETLSQNVFYHEGV